MAQRSSKRALERRHLLTSLFVTVMFLVICGGILKVVDHFITVIPAYVTVTIESQTLSADERQNVRERLQEVGVPEVSIEKIMTSPKGAMLFVSRADGTRFNDEQFAEFRKAQQIDSPDESVRGVLVFLKKLQLKGVKFEDAAVRVDRIPLEGR